MLKCSSDRCVCASHSLLLGTSTSPRLSVSLRIPITFTLLIALITFSLFVYPQFPGTVVPELRCGSIVIEPAIFASKQRSTSPFPTRGWAFSAASCPEQGDLVSIGRSVLGGLIYQPHVNENRQTLPEDRIEIRLVREILGVGCVWRFRKRRSCQVRSGALGTAIGFTRGRHLTALILNHWRPVGAYYRPHQLRKI